MNKGIWVGFTTVTLVACGGDQQAESCPTSDGPHWQRITMPKTLEVVESVSLSGSLEDRVAYDGTLFWFWVGTSAIAWDPRTDEWNQIPGFDGVELYDDPFVRVVAGRLVVWGDRDAQDNIANDSPTARLEGFVHHGDLGWRETAAPPNELHLQFSGAVTDDQRLYVFTYGGSTKPLQVGIYDVHGDTWQHVETPFPSEEVGRLSGFETWHPWAAAGGKLLLADRNNGVWILDPATFDWSHIAAVVSSGQLRSLTATSDRVFAWSDAPEGVEVLLNDLQVRRLELPENLYGSPHEAGDWVVFRRSDADWLVFDPRTDTFTSVGIDCQPELPGYDGAYFTVATEYGFVVSGELDWGAPPTYERGKYPREARLLVFPDSTPLRP